MAPDAPSKLISAHNITREKNCDHQEPRRDHHYANTMSKRASTSSVDKENKDRVAKRKRSRSPARGLSTSSLRSTPDQGDSYALTLGLFTGHRAVEKSNELPVPPTTLCRSLRRGGNLCYLNATLQFLLHIPPAHHTIGGHTCSSPHLCVMCALRAVLEDVLDGTRSHPASNSPVANFLPWLMPDSSPNSQEDASELLFSLFNLIQVQTNVNVLYSHGSLPSSDSRSSWVEMTFGGPILRKQIVCKCGAISSHLESTLGLIVPMGLSVSSIMKQYFSKLSLPAYHCSNCERTRPATLQYNLVRQPPVLLIHVARFRENGEKDTSGILVDPTLVVHQDDSGLLDYNYSLGGIVSHLGETRHSGHWISHVRMPNGFWAEYDDDICTIRGNSPPSTPNAVMIAYHAQAPGSLPAAQPLITPPSPSNDQFSMWDRGVFPRSTHDGQLSKHYPLLPQPIYLNVQSGDMEWEPANGPDLRVRGPELSGGPPTQYDAVSSRLHTSMRTETIRNDPGLPDMSNPYALHAGLAALRIDETSPLTRRAVLTETSSDSSESFVIRGLISVRVAQRITYAELRLVESMTSVEITIVSSKAEPSSKYVQEAMEFPFPSSMAYIRLEGSVSGITEAFRRISDHFVLPNKMPYIIVRAWDNDGTFISWRKKDGILDAVQRKRFFHWEYIRKTVFTPEKPRYSRASGVLKCYFRTTSAHIPRPQI